MAAAAAGTGLAWTSPVLGQLEKPDSLIETTKEQRSWIASMLAIGAICGALPCGILADKLGRKKAAMFISVPYIVSFLMTATASSPFALYAARFLIGNYCGSLKPFIRPIRLIAIVCTFHRHCNRWIVRCGAGVHQ